MKIIKSKYQEKHVNSVIDWEAIIKDELIKKILYDLRPIVESQITTEGYVSTVSLHVFTDTQIQTMNRIFNEYDKSSPLYQEALHILNN